MSIYGRTAGLGMHVSLQDNDAVDRVLRPLRMTPSSGPSRRSERGIRAVMASFSLPTQIGVRRLISERYALEAKMRAAEDRAASTRQSTLETDDMRALRLAIADSDYNIKRLVGPDAYPHVMAILGEPTVADSMKLSIQSEESAREVAPTAAEGERAARVWRLTLGSVGHRVGAKTQYRYVSHDSPDHRGGRSLVNKLNTRTGEENLSYFETVQLRHGRTRRGSCSFAGVHEEVFGPSGVMRPAPEPVPISARGDAFSPGSALGGGHAAAHAAHAAAQRRADAAADAYHGGGDDGDDDDERRGGAGADAGADEAADEAGTSISWGAAPAPSAPAFVDRRYVSAASPKPASPRADADDDLKAVIAQSMRALHGTQGLGRR
jgi:hypothetical protein